MSFAAVVGGVAAVGGLIAGNNAANTANGLFGDQIDVLEAQQAFAQQQYYDWKRLYGPIEQNLSEFYNELTPDYFRDQGLQAYEKQFIQQQQQLDEHFAANKVETGVVLDLKNKSALQATRDKAQIRADAPLRTAEAKSNFLSIGIGQKAATTFATANAANNLSGAYGQQAGYASASADAGFQAAASGFGVVADELDRRYTADQGTTQVT